MEHCPESAYEAFQATRDRNDRIAARRAASPVAASADAPELNGKRVLLLTVPRSWQGWSLPPVTREGAAKARALAGNQCKPADCRGCPCVSCVGRDPDADRPRFDAPTPAGVPVQGVML